MKTRVSVVSYKPDSAGMCWGALTIKVGKHTWRTWDAHLYGPPAWGIANLPPDLEPVRARIQIALGEHLGCTHCGRCFD